MEFKRGFRLSQLATFCIQFIGDVLQKILGIKVDLVEKGTLKPRIGKHVLEEVVEI